MRITPSTALNTGHMRGSLSLRAPRPRATSMVKLPPDPHIRRARTHVRRYVTTTTICPHPNTDRDPLLEGIRDAADECSHGSLPTDRTIRCGCWKTPGSPVSTGGFLLSNGTMQ